MKIVRGWFIENKMKNTQTKHKWWWMMRRRNLSRYVYGMVMLIMTSIDVVRRMVANDKSCGTRKGNSLVCERAFWSSSSAQLHAKLFGLSTKLECFPSACHKAIFDATMRVRVTRTTNTVYICVCYMMGVHSITVTMLEWSRSQMGLLQRNRNGYI